MLRVCLLLFAALLTYARAFCDLTQKQDCSQFREEFEKALECPYGIHTTTQDGCQRWKCIEDPCIKAKCSSNDHCEAIELSSPSYQGDWFIATCVAGDICEPFKQECNELHDCFFGIQKTTDSDGCKRCECKPDPCKNKSCAAGKRCVVQKSKPLIGQEPQFSPICGTTLPQKEVVTSASPSNSRGLVWVERPWGQCSTRSGSGGIKSRVVTCQKINGNGINSKVPHKECFDLLGPNPELFQPCNEDAPPTWFVGDWSPCDKFCEEGEQTREVVCQKNINGAIELLDDENCTEEKPKKEQPCMMLPCTEVIWVTTEWFGCDSCTSKFRTRMVICTTKDQQVLNERSCSHIHRPVDREACAKDVLPACEVQWYTTQWSNCSVHCGDGEQTRTVFCGMYYQEESGEVVKVVDDAKCANLTKNYKDTKPCTVPKEECSSEWFTGPWSECTKPCGEGEQYRRVMCFRGDQSAYDCDGATDFTQLCNIGPCDAEQSLPTFTEEAQA